MMAEAQLEASQITSAVSSGGMDACRETQSGDGVAARAGLEHAQG
jgi:hypothetical protein